MFLKGVPLWSYILISQHFLALVSYFEIFLKFLRKCLLSTHYAPGTAFQEFVPRGGDDHKPDRDGGEDQVQQNEKGRGRVQRRGEPGSVGERSPKMLGWPRGLSKRVTSEEAPKGMKRAGRRMREEGTAAIGFRREWAQVSEVQQGGQYEGGARAMEVRLGQVWTQKGLWLLGEVRWEAIAGLSTGDLDLTTS